MKRAQQPAERSVFDVLAEPLRVGCMLSQQARKAYMRQTHYVTASLSCAGALSMVGFGKKDA